MQILRYPPRETWQDITERPSIEAGELQGAVADILENIRKSGDAALREYTRRFDKVEIDRLEVSDEEFAKAEATVPAELKEALAIAKRNIEAFHRLPDEPRRFVETMPGVVCWSKSLPIEKVGLYIPAGTAPLFSTVLMLAIPAMLAGCGEIVAVSPPRPDGSIDATTLYAARLCGVTRFFKAGGAQAIAALTFGTESIPAVYKIFGPGNQYVTEAKLQAMRYGVAIDMPAGPSEVAVVADDSCVPDFVAADLLSQAEHGADSQVLMVTNSETVIARVTTAVEEQLALLERRGLAAAALANSRIVLLGSLDEATELINEYAPEHLILACENADQVAERITNAGSIFLGNYSCESAGDYASGTNHTLPTGGAARAFSGVSTRSFMKNITYQRLSADGIAALGPVIERMAEAEGLGAHARAVSIRLESLGGRDV